MPHEILMGERDAPGAEIPLWLLFFDIQATDLMIRTDNQQRKSR